MKKIIFSFCFLIMSAFSSGASALTAALCGYSPYDAVLKK